MRWRTAHNRRDRRVRRLRRGWRAIDRLAAALGPMLWPRRPIDLPYYLGRNEAGDHFFVTDPRVADDLRHYGIGITRGGERIDPREVFLVDASGPICTGDAPEFVIYDEARDSEKDA